MAGRIGGPGRRGTWERTTCRVVVSVFLALSCAPPPAAQTIEVVEVTNRDDAGPGSLRAALSRGYRHVRLGQGVDGDVLLTRDIRVGGPFVVLDGEPRAGGSGLTVRGHGISIRGRDGAHDVTIRNLRIRDAADDGIQVTAGAYNVDIDHVSISGCHDGNIDITQSRTRDVVVRSSILRGGKDNSRNMLLGNLATGIRLFGNILLDARQRNPEVSFDQTPASTRDTGTTVDLRNNVFWAWGRGRGPRIEEGATANVIGNYFGGPPRTDLGDALIVCTGEATASKCSNRPTNRARAYARGNVLRGSSIDLDARGTEATAFPAPDIATVSACAAVSRAIAEAGARPRDALDSSFVATIAACDEPGSSLTPVPTQRPTPSVDRSPEPARRRSSRR